MPWRLSGSDLQTEKSEAMKMTHAENRLSVNGLDMYYEVHGAGQPLVLLHGALSTIDTSFGAVLPSLA